MSWLRDYQIKLKEDGRASVLINHIQRIVNNNKTPGAWTDEERKNPVIFDKQIQTYISLAIAAAKNKESGTVLSGGNFDFKDSTGSGYLLELQYIDNNQAVKEVVKAIRESCGFACIPGHNSTSCYLAERDASEPSKDSALQKVCEALEAHLSKIKETEWVDTIVRDVLLLIP